LGVQVPGQAVCKAARALRGGSWNNHQNNARSTYRNNNDPAERNNNNGFRVVLLSRPSSSVPSVARNSPFGGECARLSAGNCCRFRQCLPMTSRQAEAKQRRSADLSGPHA